VEVYDERTSSRLAWRSAWNRRFTLGAHGDLDRAVDLTMLLGVERIRTRAAREGFASSVSGTDLIVGARTGSTQLLLYSVFRIGAATNNIAWRACRRLPPPGRGLGGAAVAGRFAPGFAVLGTTPGYFAHFRYGDRNR
jgi:putative ABC transport system permease protein